MTGTRDLGIALGCVVYDLRHLATALTVRSRQFGRSLPVTVRNDAKRLASEVMLLKSRVLLEFLAPKSRNDRDIQVYDFNMAPVPLPPPLGEFRDWVSKRSVHLSWSRAEAELPAFRDLHGISLERCAYQVFVLAHGIVQSLRQGGLELALGRHATMLTVLTQQATVLTRTEFANGEPGT